MNYKLLVEFIPYVFPGIFCTSILLVFILTDRSFSKSLLRTFLVAITCGFCLVISDAFDYYLEIEKQNYQLRQVLGSINFIFRLTCGGFFVRISQRKNKIHVRVIDSILLINLIISLLDIKFHWISTVHPDHTYTFGPFIFVTYFITFILAIFYIYSTVTMYRTNRGEAVTLMVICVICLVTNVVEIVYSIKIVLAQAMCISAVLYFLCLINELYKRDALTDLFNRRTLFLDSISWKKNDLGVIMLDLNDLKKFNDTEGHSAGDLAIMTSVDVMKKVFIKYGRVYRIGGDEFCVLVKDKHISKIETLLETFDQSMQLTKYRVAYGYSIYNANSDFEKVLEEADAKMYEKKKLMKASV